MATAAWAKLLEQSGYDHVRTYRWSLLPELLVQAGLHRVLDRTGNGADGEMPAAAAPAAGPPPAGPLSAPSARSAAQSAAGDRDRPAATSAMGRAETAARQGLDLFYTGLQLGPGRIPVSDRVPQTLIVVARRR